MEEQRNAVKAAFFCSESTSLDFPMSFVTFRLSHWHVKGWKAYFVLILQADIVRCAIDDDETCHIMGALPTGYGKSLPMLVTGLLMPPGKYGHTKYMQHMFISSR